MTIKNLMEMGLFDENERVAVLCGDVNKPSMVYSGRLCEVSEKFCTMEIFTVGAMNDRRREQLGLNKNNAYTEIWLEEE